MNGKAPQQVCDRLAILCICILLGFVQVALSGCSENGSPMAYQQYGLSGSLDGSTLGALSVDGDYTTAIEIIAGKKDLVGTAWISHNTEEIRLIMELDGDLVIDQLQVHWATDPNLIPQNKPGNPVIGKFDNKYEINPSSSIISFSYSFSEIGVAQGDSVFCAIHADAVSSESGESGLWVSGVPFPGKGPGMYVAHYLTPCWDVMFISDESGRPNIWRGYLTDGGIQDRKQVTFYETIDVISFDIERGTGQLTYVLREPGVYAGRLFVSDADGLNAYEVSGLPATGAASSVWMENSRILFVEGSSGHSSYSGLSAAAINSDGSNYERVLYAYDPDGPNRRPTHKNIRYWSPEGYYLSVTKQYSMVEDSRSIYFMDAMGILHKIKRGGWGRSNVFPSPDGSQIVFRTSQSVSGTTKAGISLLPTAQPSSNEIVIIPRTRGLQVVPEAWLTDNRIIYRRRYAGDGEQFDFWAMLPDGSQQRNLTQTESVNEYHFVFFEHE